MEAFAYFALAFMLTAYAVLDGFDFGAGVVHFLVAKTDDERRAVIAAIGPVWDGNEVWLIAAGGTLVFCFPRAYAAAFSGLYLPLMIVLWLLVLRGVAIEVRSKLEDPLWRAGWDGVFAFASSVMAIVLGVALGNVVRGVPIDASGYFQEDLFATADHAGAIDAYTAMLGLLALVALAAHGATWLALKTTKEVRARSVAVARRAWLAAIALAIVATAISAATQRAFFGAVLARPWVWPLPLGAIAAAFVARDRLARGRDLAAFGASCAFVALLVLATACALYPVILRSTIDPALSIDAHGAATRQGLGVGLAIWAGATGIAVGYFVHLYRVFAGRAES